MGQSYNISVEQVPVQSARLAIDQAEAVGELTSPDATAAIAAAKDAAADSIERFAVGKDGYVSIQIEGTVSVDEDEARTSDELSIHIFRVEAPDGSSPLPSQPDPEVEPVQDEQAAPEPPQVEVPITDAAGNVSSVTANPAVGSDYADTPSEAQSAGGAVIYDAADARPAGQEPATPPPVEPEPEPVEEGAEATVPDAELPAGEPGAATEATPAADVAGLPDGGLDVPAPAEGEGVPAGYSGVPDEHDDPNKADADEVADDKAELEADQARVDAAAEPPQE